MRRTKKIKIALFSYVLILVGIYFCVDFYINIKDNWLSNKIWDDFNHIFDNKIECEFLDVAYSNNDVKYQKVTTFTPIRTNDSIYAYLFPNDYDFYNGIERLFKLDYDTPGRYICDNGWCLYLIRRSGLDVLISKIFPYAIGFSSNSVLDENNIKDLVHNSYQYLTTSDEKHHSSFEEGSYDRIKGKLMSLRNKFYDIDVQLGDTNYFYGDKHVDNRRKPSLYYLPYNTVGNDNMRVFIGKTVPYQYKIIHKTRDVEAYKNKLHVIWWIVLSIIFLSYIILLWHKDYTYKKYQSESLYTKLKRLCNPQQFMKKYNKEKVDIANSIYQKLLETAPDDHDALLLLLREAEESLKIEILDKEMISEMKEIVNPKKFMESYDAEKISLANELFNRLNLGNLTYEEFLEIEEKAKHLQ